jgi:hypothetical protein
MSSQEELSWITDEHCKLMDNARLCFGDGTSRDDPSVGDAYMYSNGTSLVTVLSSGSSAGYGTKANTAGSGIVLTGDDYGVFRVFSDDNGASVAASVRGIQSRTLLTFDQAGGTIRALQGHLRLLTGIDVTTGIYTAVQGYVELAGTHISKTGATFSAFDSSTEITTSLTINSGGEYYGVHVETTGAGTITQDSGGYCAAVGITKASGAASWPMGLYISPLATITPISVGTKANVVGSGVTIPSTDDWGAVRVFTDDNGANVADSVRGIQSRMLLTFDQSAGTLRAIQGQVKYLDGIDVTSGVYTAVQGYNEYAATHSVKTGSVASCFDASTEIGTALTIDSGGRYAGIHVETTGAGTITNNGTCAGILIDKASGAAKWPIGLLVKGADAICGISVGEFAATYATGSAIVLSSAATSAVRFYGESVADGTSALNLRTVVARHLIVTASGTVAHESYGLVGQLCVKNTTLTHLHAGLMGTFEVSTAATINSAYAFGVAGVIARLGVGTSILIATKPVCGFAAVYNGGALSSGSSVAFASCSTTATNFTYWGALSGVDNVFYAAAGTAYEHGVKIGSMSALGGATHTASGLIRVVVGSTIYYIPLYAAGEVTGE